MNSQKRETAKSKSPKSPKRGGQPLLSRVRPLSALLPASRVRVVKPSLWNFPKQPPLPQHQRYFEAPQRARTFSVSVKLREPPKPPVEIIQIHSNPSNPSKSPIPPIPQNITFEMLADLYTDELLLTEINNLEKNAEEIAKKIINNNNFEDTIARLISECKEKVRRMLWNNFYTTLTGNAKTLSGSNGGNGGNGGNTDDYDAWYGDDASSKTAKPIVVKWRFRLSVFSFVSRVLKYCIKLLSEQITDTDSVAPPARRHDRQYYIDKMETMKKTILRDLRKSGIIPEQLKRIEANFVLVPKDKVELAMKVQDILESHSLSKLHTAFPPDIRNSGVYNRLYQPFTGIRNTHLKLHGMSLPYQFDRIELLRNMLYILQRYDIKNFIDLHDCEGITNISGCNPYDLSGERDMFDLAVKVMKTRGRQYINVKGYVDMRSGSYSAWLEISKIPDTSVYETLVHCYMGRGRTGSVLLFLLLRDCKNTPIDLLGYRLREPHLRYESIFELRNVIVSLFDDNHTVKDVVEELFNATDMKHIRLLRQRLNRIFFFLAKKHKVSHVCLYRDIPQKPKIIDEIRRRLRREKPKWDDGDIEYEYGKYPSDATIISSEFSETEIYEMSVIEKMRNSDIERILNGYDISTRHSM
jgi:hypothetical protein